MKALIIADTHGFHRDLVIPPGIQMIIHAGDIANTSNPGINANECIDFLEWFRGLEIKYKILIAGNHDTSIEAGLINPRNYPGIIYMYHETAVIEGKVFFGSPYTPTFGNGWAYNVPRHKLESYWADIPRDVHVLITHGPPHSILDLGQDNNLKPDFCGCKALYNRVIEVEPRYHLYGHIHENGWCLNKGRRILPGITTEFINASCVTDRKFNLGLTSQGIIIEI